MELIYRGGLTKDKEKDLSLERCELPNKYKKTGLIRSGRFFYSLPAYAVGKEEMAMYDRESAVRYAEKWWNKRNPAFPAFAVDCTNYVSQCLLAGGAPMRGGYADRKNGWWVGGGTWSFSWSVTHSLRWYLEGSKKGLKAVRKASAADLLPGDVIIYDFNGDGRMDHAAFVVSRQNGVPLVNAHTADSYHRHWSYTTSPAHTDGIRYYFFHIDENTSL